MSGGVAAWAGSWRSALRISRREVLRHRSRNLLIVAMLALPVLAAVAAETTITDAKDLTVGERLERTVGGFDALVQAYGAAPLYQSAADLPPLSVPANQGTSTGASTDQGAGAPGTADSETDYATAAAGVADRITAVLPRAKVVTESSAADVFAQGPAGYTTVVYLQTALADPGFRGVIDLTAGRAAAAADEIDLSPAAASALGVGVGGRVTLPASSLADRRAETVTVVGLARLPGSTKEADLFAPAAAPAAVGAADAAWYVHQAGGVSWAQVQSLNEHGLVAASRDVYRDLPPASQVPYYAAMAREAEYAVSPGVSATEASVGAIVVGIALLEVVLLAGPAFAVSAKRREREFAMIGAAGADAADLRRIVLADGLVLGALAGVCGVGLGIGAAAAALPLAGRYDGSLPGALHVNALHALGVALLAVVLGLCAAYLPARAVATRDLAAGLADRPRRTSRRTRRGRIATGLVLAALGLCGVFLAHRVPSGQAALAVVGGVALVEVGGILCTPAIVAGAARLGRVLPLGPRLALRDSARHPGRTTPAVAAMFAAVAGAVAAGAWLDSSLAQARAAYQPMMLTNQVAVTGVADAGQAARIVDALRTVLPVTGSTLTGPVGAVPGPAGTKGTWGLSIGPQVTGFIEQGGQWIDSGGSYGTTTVDFGGDGSLSGYSSIAGSNYGLVQNIVGDAQTLRTVTGLDDAHARQVLAQGGVVMFVQSPPPGDTVQVRSQYLYTTSEEPDKTRLSTKTLTVPVDYVTENGFPDPGFVLAPATAHALGVDAATGPRTLLVNLSARATADQMYRGGQVLDRLGVQSPLAQETGLHSRMGLANVVVLLVAMLVAIGAAAIATGLALADGRRDQATISAVGGSPWTRRRMAGSTALVITGLGVLIGVPVGLVLGAGAVRVAGSSLTALSTPGNWLTGAPAFRVPWLDLCALALAVPLLTACGAALLSRSQAPDSGRVAD